MLSLLKIKNIALISELEIEFAGGLNLLTGETGSGKSIIVDSLGALTGDRVSSELIKQGADSAMIEALFIVEQDRVLEKLLDDSGIQADDQMPTELIIRRDLSAGGRNRIFVNDQMVTRSLLKKVGAHLVDIYGQGEQAALYDRTTHLGILDRFAGTGNSALNVASAYQLWADTRKELAGLRGDETERLRLIDVLKFQIDEINRAGLGTGEDESLEEEKRRLNNVEKLSGLSAEIYALLYENSSSTFATLEKASRLTDELAGYDSKFGEYKEGLLSARAVVEDLAASTRDFLSHLEFSPERLEEIESRLSQISSLKRKYGSTLTDILDHLQLSESQLQGLETTEFREEELRSQLAVFRKDYISAATKLHDERAAAAKKFEKEVERNLRAVALEKAQFIVNIESPSVSELERAESDEVFSIDGYDRVEFYFSANPGESPRPLAKIASGGEASRLMLILKTTASHAGAGKTAVFDEIDVGIGGRVAEAVGLKLKELSSTQQVLCVTHQPQIASLADSHFFVEKSVSRARTGITVRQLDIGSRIDEIARMLAGEKITETAREHAREMLNLSNEKGEIAAR